MQRKEIHGRKEERHWEALHRSLSFPFSDRVSAMFWEFTDSLKNVYQLARSILGSADCAFQSLWISWVRNSPVKGVAILHPILSPGPCTAPSSWHHSCLLWQEHHKWLPVWVRSSQAQGFCFRSYESPPVLLTGHLATFFFFNSHSLINMKGSERRPLHGPLHFKR